MHRSYSSAKIKFLILTSTAYQNEPTTSRSHPPTPWPDMVEDILAQRPNRRGTPQQVDVDFRAHPTYAPHYNTDKAKGRKNDTRGFCTIVDALYRSPRVVRTDEKDEHGKTVYRLLDDSELMKVDPKPKKRRKVDRAKIASLNYHRAF